MTIPPYFPYVFSLFIVVVTVIFYDITTIKKSKTFFDESMLNAALTAPLPTTDGLSSNDTINAVSKFCSIDNTLCLPPFLSLNEPFVRKVVIVPKYKLLSCILPKCMSTITTQIFSYLYDKQKYTEYTWSGQKKSATHHENDFDSMSTFKHNTHTTDNDLKKEWKMLVSVRNPLDRFVSAFNNKCVNERLRLTLDPVLYGGNELCYGCKDDVACYLRKQFIRAKMYAKGGLGRVGYEDQHTFPQSWFCNFKEFLNDFKIFKQTSKSKKNFRGFVMNLLNSVNATVDERSFIDNHILIQKSGPNDTPQIDRSKEIKETILKDPNLLKLFIAMYYYDYILFDFDFPSEAKKLFQNDLLINV